MLLKGGVLRSAEGSAVNNRPVDVTVTFTQLHVSPCLLTLLRTSICVYS